MATKVRARLPMPNVNVAAALLAKLPLVNTVAISTSAKDDATPK
jgi:hypothetical protein